MFDGRPVTTYVFFAVGPAELVDRSSLLRKGVILYRVGLFPASAVLPLGLLAI